MQRGQVSASCLVQPFEVKPTEEEIKSCIKDNKLLLACGKKIPLLSSACVEPFTGVRSKMPVVKGRVGERSLDVLRDTGCSGIVVEGSCVQGSVHWRLLMLCCSSTTHQGKCLLQRLILTRYLKGQVLKYLK